MAHLPADGAALRLPARQVGPNLYTDGPPDVTAGYANVVLVGLPAGARCDTHSGLTGPGRRWGATALDPS